MRDYYPYPKLQKNSDDYVSSFIDCEINYIESGGHLVIQGTFQISDEELENMILEGNASFCLLIECSATNHREVVKTPASFSCNLIKAGYSEKLLLTPGIIMNEEIKGYRNKSLNDEYQDSYVILPAGAMIAESEQYELTLLRNSYENVESICKFIKGKKYDYRLGDRIEIELPEKVYDSYLSLRTKECGQIFTSMYAVPVIQAVIQEHWIDDKNDCSDRWHIILDEKIKDMFNGDLSRCSAFDIAVEILEGLMSDSSEYLSKHYGEAYEY